MSGWAWAELVGMVLLLGVLALGAVLGSKDEKDEG